MKSRKELIRIIEALFPTDSEFENTNEVGRKLLAQAKEEVQKPYDWRDESMDVLERYAELCQIYEANEHARLIRQIY